MVDSNTDPEADVVDIRTMELMEQFEAHFKEVVQAEPLAEDLRDRVFQAWTFQKLAGIQLSIEETARKFNAPVNTTK